MKDNQVAEAKRQAEQRVLAAQRAQSPYSGPPLPLEPPPRPGQPQGGQPQMSQAERLQNLRAHHQRIHQERQGRYPHEEVEEQYEKHLLQLERQVDINSTI